MGRAYRGADLAVLCGHAVSVMQVCKGLGRSPGLQVPGHADGSPHLGSIEGGSRSEEVLGAPSFSLGVRNKALHLAGHRCTASRLPALPTKKPPLSKRIPLTSCPSLSWFLLSFLQWLVFSAMSCWSPMIFFFQTTKLTCIWNLGKNNSYFKGCFYKVDS